MKTPKDFFKEAVHHVDGAEYNVNEAKLEKAFYEFADYLRSSHVGNVVTQADVGSKIKTSSEQAKLIESISSVVNIKIHNIVEEWFFLPFYFKKSGENMYDVVSFENLPKHVVDFIKHDRQSKETFESDPGSTDTNEIVCALCGISYLKCNCP